MKKVSLTLLTIGMVTAFIFSCSKREMSTNNANEANANYQMQTASINEESFIALHNQSLASFISDVEQNSDFYKNSPEPTEEMFDYIENYMQVNMNHPDTDANWITNFYANFRTFNANLNSQSEFVNLSQTHYYNRVMEVLDNDLSYTEVNVALEYLRDSLNSDPLIDENDRLIIEQGILIGKESYEYWSTNDYVWSSLESSMNKTTGKDRGKMAQADVEGAITGALTGAATSGPAFVVGALAGATLGAAWDLRQTLLPNILVGLGLGIKIE